MRRTKVAAAAVTMAAMALVGSAGGAAADTADTAGCTVHIYRVNVDHLYDWENDGPMGSDVNYSESIWFRGEYVRGTGGLRPNGWVPVEKYGFSDRGPWNSLLEGPNDQHDFIRKSGLDWIKCA